MLTSLEALAGKISPGSGTNSPTNKQQLDNNDNRIINHHNVHNNIHPYHKPNLNNNLNNINNNNNHDPNIIDKHKTMDITSMMTTQNNIINNNNNSSHNNNNNNNDVTSENNNQMITNNNHEVSVDGGDIIDDEQKMLQENSNSSLGDSLQGSMTSTTAGEQPDPDYIKMFVGQVPKSMDEEQLKNMFEEYGRVHSLNVLRDKVTGISKGCCFVTFFTRKAALKAQDALHNIKTLDGMHHPIQMKPADSESRNERKLFIGMLQKKLNENDIRAMFARYGTIEECTVLRDQNGQSKGCAFVTFSSKQSAISAIKALHQSQTMEGCSAPIVVKFADTQKEKEQKKLQQLQANLWNLTAAANINVPIAQPTPPPVIAPILANPQPSKSSQMLTADMMSSPSLQLLQQLQAVGLQQQFLQGIQQQQQQESQQQQQQQVANAAQYLPQISIQNLQALASMTQPQMQAPTLANHNPSPQAAQLTNALLWAEPQALSNQYLQTTQLQHFSSTGLTASQLVSQPQLTVTNNVSTIGKQIDTNLKRNVAWRNTDIGQMILLSGPDGCNLFIYHLPQEFTDTDLASTFLPFGTVISAKVFIDKQTNLSKCFGFVSFDNPDSAQAAIKAMHGFQIGTKRLKVQLKKPKDASKPY